MTLREADPDFQVADRGQRVPNGDLGPRHRLAAPQARKRYPADAASPALFRSTGRANVVATAVMSS
jgi:hypothetical protein